MVATPRPVPEQHSPGRCRRQRQGLVEMQLLRTGAGLASLLLGGRAGAGRYPYQPTPSRIALVDPAALKRSIMPFAPSLTTTRLGTVRPAAQLRSDAFGWAAPSGQIVRWLGAVVFGTVT